ncbi:MAG: zinc-dependent alcohol dehydrogenase family protein [Planctomycetota bacterium]
MRAWILDGPAPLEERPLRLVERPDPVPGPGEIVIDVDACGLCRTDIHIAEGEIELPTLPLVPGHQAVGRVAARGEGAERFPDGARAGVAWLHRTCARCPDCARAAENLCRDARFTGYHVDGGFAERLRVPESFAYELPGELDDVHAAPLLCAGIIGFRALGQADVTSQERVGLYGFGSSAHVALQVARHRRNRVFVVTRNEEHRELARRMGAEWAGGSADTPPEPLDRVVIFAPAGELVPRALEAVRWGGTVASAAIHMSPIPELDYTRHLFGERTLRSTTAATRRDGIELMETAHAARIVPEVTVFPFEECPEGLLAIKNDQIQGSAVLRVR